MAKTVQVSCGCGARFTARAADRARGWARSCSKSCAAKRRERRPCVRVLPPRVLPPRGRKGSDLQREFGGIPMLDRHGGYVGFALGPGNGDDF